MSKIKLLILAIFASILMTGCLTVEKKQYRVAMTGDKTGRCTVKFVNIVSLKNEDVDLSVKDFDEFIDNFYKGKKLEDSYKGGKNFSKRIFVEKDQLCAELSFDFDNLSLLNLYQYQNGCPYVLIVSGKDYGEKLQSTNGERPEEGSSIVFFQSGQRILEWTTVVSEDMKDAVSLVDLYKEWQEKNK